MADVISYCRRVGIYAALTLSILFAPAPAPAQLSSMATLSGAYYFRYLGVNASPANRALSAQGTVTFDGNGGFTVTGQGVLAGASSLKLPTLGKYSVLSSGLLNMTNPLDASGNAKLFGAVGSGAVVASSAGTAYHDLFVAIPVSAAASNATLSGTYNTASLEFLNGSIFSTRDTFFSMTADGKGGLGNVTIKGTALDLNSAPAVQSSTGATYTVNPNGSGSLNLPAPNDVAANNVLLSGNKTLYVSEGGSLFIAGGPAAFDLIVGVKAFSGAVAQNALSGLYFTGLLENYRTGTTADGIYSSAGSANQIPSLKLEIAHQRVSPDGGSPYDLTQSRDFTLALDGTASYADSQYSLGPQGDFVIGAGNGGNYQLSFYVRAPTFSGAGVFLNPQGVINAANYAPVTAPVAPGELISLNGSGIATQTLTASSLPWPNFLGGVQVTVNGIAAPVYSVSPTVVSAVVPFSVPADGSLLTVQVSNNGTASNPVLVYSGQTSPGVFTVTPGGIGNGAILHADFSLVSSTSPAKAGETVQIFVTGLGAVSPPVPSGAAGPANPLSRVVNMPEVYIGGLGARVTYAGLAPTLAGLYQLNVTIPSGVSTGNVSVEISTVDADNLQATIPIGK